MKSTPVLTSNELVLATYVLLFSRSAAGGRGFTFGLGAALRVGRFGPREPAAGGGTGPACDWASRGSLRAPPRACLPLSTGEARPRARDAPPPYNCAGRPPAA